MIETKGQVESTSPFRIETGMERFLRISQKEKDKMHKPLRSLLTPNQARIISRIVDRQMLTNDDKKLIRILDNPIPRATTVYKYDIKSNLSPEALKEFITDFKNTLDFQSRDELNLICHPL